MELCWIGILVQCSFILVIGSPLLENNLSALDTVFSKTNALHKLISPKKKKFEFFQDEYKNNEENKGGKLEHEQEKKLAPETSEYESKSKRNPDFSDTLDDTFSVASSMHHRFAEEEDEYYVDYKDTDEENSDNFASLIRLIGQPPTSFSGFSNSPSIIATNSLSLSSVSTVRPPPAYPNSPASKSKISPFEGNHLSRRSSGTSSYSSPSSQSFGSGNFVNNFQDNQQSHNTGNHGNRFSQPSPSYGAPSGFYGAPPNTQRPTTRFPATQRPTTRYSAPPRPQPTRPSPPILRPTPRPNPRPSPAPHPGSPQVSMPYQFEWQVLDHVSGNDYLHRQASDGQVTQGQYEVLLPDGRRQIVVFRVDGDSGYQAEVRYEGEINSNFIAQSGTVIRPGGGMGKSYGGAGGGGRT